MAMSDYLEAVVLQSSLNAVAFPSLPSVFVSLHTSATTDAGGGTEVTTVGTGYVRQEVIADWTVTGVATRAGNTSLVEWPVALAGYGTVSHVGIWDAVTAGNLLYHGALAVPQAVLINQIFQIAADALGLTVGAPPA